MSQKLNKQFEEAEMLITITRIATEVFEDKIKEIIKEDE